MEFIGCVFSSVAWIIRLKNLDEAVIRGLYIIAHKANKSRHKFFEMILCQQILYHSFAVYFDVAM